MKIFSRSSSRRAAFCPNNSGDFPRLSRCFHQSTNENMCFLLPKIFFFWRSERELRKGRVRKNSPDRKRREIFLEFICALWLWLSAGIKGSSAARRRPSVMSICWFNCRGVRFGRPLGEKRCDFMSCGMFRRFFTRV